MAIEVNTGGQTSLNSSPRRSSKAQLTFSSNFHTNNINIPRVFSTNKTSTSPKPQTRSSPSGRGATPSANRSRWSSSPFRTSATTRFVWLRQKKPTTHTFKVGKLVWYAPAFIQDEASDGDQEQGEILICVTLSKFNVDKRDQDKITFKMPTGSVVGIKGVIQNEVLQFNRHLDFLSSD